MIKRINKIKKFGIFHDFSWNAELPEFKKFNLIYGWNRSGKTTISRVFESCEKKCIYDPNKFEQYPINGEFEIKTSDGTTIKNTDVATNSLPIKIFNQDFIKENISFDPSDSCNPIIYVSEEDIESKKRLEQLKLEKMKLGKAYEEAKKETHTKEETKGSFLTGLGREIANILFDKSYNRTKAENKINSIGIDNFSDKELSVEDKKKYESISKSEAGKSQDTLLNYQFSFLIAQQTINDFQKIYNAVEKLLGKKVISETLDRLKDDPSLNNWVKQGFDLYKTKKEQEKCLFCRKPLDSDFLSSLSNHFNKDYDDFQSAIVFLKDEILKIKKTTIALKNDDLHPDLKKSYTTKAKELNIIVEKINAWIDEIEIILNKKYNNPLIAVASPKAPEEFLTSYNQIVADLNKIILNHNEKVNNHANEVSTAKEKIELHLIAVALMEQDYNKMLTDINEASELAKTAKKAFDDCNVEIISLENKTSDIARAIPKINKHLKEFFGREEIKLDIDGNKKNYIIKRDGQPANNLSEGEKTAIAFSYFIVKVGEGDFDKSKGIIFIDDPISSFDSNFIYHCFSLIKNHFKEVGQLFISTHNFQLFNLAKEWLINKNNTTNKDNKKAKTEGKSEKETPCEFFMIENYTESDVRKAKIIELDKTLRNFKSEYHFLFAKLTAFSQKQDTEYEDLYTIGNMARRFIDIFADFKIPTTGNQKSKMDVLIKNINEREEKISTVNADKAYKLVNEFSHNSDPISTIEHKDKSESKNAINILLDIVKKSDPKHYEILEKNI